MYGDPDHHHHGYAASTHTHNRDDVYGAAERNHIHHEYASAGHDHDQNHHHDGQYASMGDMVTVAEVIANLVDRVRTLEDILSLPATGPDPAPFPAGGEAVTGPGERPGIQAETATEP